MHLRLEMLNIMGEKAMALNWVKNSKYFESVDKTVVDQDLPFKYIRINLDNAGVDQLSKKQLVEEFEKIIQELFK